MRKALSFYQQALPLCIELGDQNCEAQSLLAYGFGLQQLGRNANRPGLLREKRGDLPAAGEPVVESVRMLNSAGALYSSLGEKKRAL